MWAPLELSTAKKPIKFLYRFGIETILTTCACLAAVLIQLNSGHKDDLCGQERSVFSPRSALLRMTALDFPMTTE
jgi:hypothetical protein